MDAPTNPKYKGSRLAEFWACLDEVERMLDEMEARDRERLECVECGEFSDGEARGWRMFLTDDDQPAVYCPGCAEAEFDTP
jgi:hypothetical protein